MIKCLSYNLRSSRNFISLIHQSLKKYKKEFMRLSRKKSFIFVRELNIVHSERSKGKSLQTALSALLLSSEGSFHTGPEFSDSSNFFSQSVHFFSAIFRASSFLNYLFLIKLLLFSLAILSCTLIFMSLIYK